MGKFIALAVVAVALNVLGPVAHAQDYVVNGHEASRAEAQLLTFYSAPAGRWQVDGYGISRVAEQHPAQPATKTGGPKCWYVLDVRLCD